MNKRKILDRCPLFSSVPADLKDRLAEMGQLQRYSKQRLLFSDRDPCPGLFVVAEGLVRVFKIGSSGQKEHVLHLARPGMTFAEAAAMGDFDCPAYAETLRESLILLLPLKPFTRLLDEEPKLARSLLSGVSRWVKQLVDLLEDITLRDAAGRVAHHLIVAGEMEEGWISLPARKKHLASPLNLSSETLSRVLRRLCEANLIEKGSKGLRLLDLEGLERVSECEHP